MNQGKLLGEIYSLKNPYSGLSLQEEKAVSLFQLKDGKLEIELKHLGDDKSLNDSLKYEIIRIAKSDFNVSGVKFSYAQEKPKKVLFSDLYPNVKVIGVMSGKGGVGKSVVTSNIVRELSKNHVVGVMDADVYGYSIPKIFNIYDEPKVIDSKIIPLSDNNIHFISAQYFIEGNKNKAIIWRGSMVNKLITHFFYDVKWPDNMEYLIIDFPPGTGDIHLSISQIIPDLNILIVTTPENDAAHVAERSGLFAKEINFNVIGIVENMSWYPHNDEKLFIWGEGGGQDIADHLNVPLLAQIPFDKNVDDNIYKKIISSF